MSDDLTTDALLDARYECLDLMELIGSVSKNLRKAIRTFEHGDDEEADLLMGCVTNQLSQLNRDSLVMLSSTKRWHEWLAEEMKKKGITQ
jgi:Na+/phosphate symporter